jgi:hypothetical protein
VIAKWRIACDSGGSISASPDGNWFAFDDGEGVFVGRRGRPAKRIARNVGLDRKPLWTAVGPTLLVEYRPNDPAGEASQPVVYSKWIAQWKPSHPVLLDIRHWSEWPMDVYRERLLWDASHDAEWLLFKDEVGAPGKAVTQIVAINRRSRKRIQWLSVRSVGNNVDWHETSR